ncbi:Excinuclease ABC subunit UvrC [Candidatus Bealeia paramacronuclearis]|uniref:UvrABC system protein C n=1 Tax=Candidatus Bealeia paramacronuclearis TaxID=1921001 RepID=A0ABZ2C3Q6_9PROT|nr:Excinuclease ABC subunit UvrC [Candidatus Bealeia paramacronuclearis]
MIKTPSLQNGISIIQNQVKHLKDVPGVYRMFNVRDDVLYVGKAKSLKKRVASYTRPEKLPLRLQRMIAETVRMEFVVTHTEAEALLLEANLIKKLEPRYNILFKDDKSFSYLHIEAGHPFPLLTKYRGARSEQGDFYGPFASTVAVNTTLTTLQRAFLLRSCSDSIFSSRKRPCLQYQIKRCSAPCVNYISQKDYAELVKDAKNFLAGRSGKIQEDLAQKMQESSDRMEYERAAQFRDRIQALTAVQSTQWVNIPENKDIDVFAIANLQDQFVIQILIFRGGCNYGAHAIYPKSVQGSTPEEILAAYISQFYDLSPAPELILTNLELPEKSLLKEALKISRKGPLDIKTPHTGKLEKILKRAHENALQALERHLAQRLSQKKILEGVAALFNLPEPPSRIEVYDNSHTQGSQPVGAMIVAGPEGFIKNAYRKFNIKSETLTPGDDYAMMREVLSRRFKRALTHDQDDTPNWPDLVLIDGGKGQLSTVREIFEDLAVRDVALVAIAKGPERNAGKETFFMTDTPPFKLEKNDPVLHYLQRLRDEAHRFAIGTHRTRRTKALTQSRLDDIPGIGPSRKRALLRHFGSAKGVEAAALEDLLRVPGIHKTIAETIHTALKKR